MALTLAPLRTQPGTKFILIFTLPSGVKLAAGGHDGKFALVPIPKDGRLKNVLAWNDSREVAKWLKEFRKQVGEDQWAKWWELKPELGRVCVEH